MLEAPNTIKYLGTVGCSSGFGLSKWNASILSFAISFIGKKLNFLNNHVNFAVVLILSMIVIQPLCLPISYKHRL